MRKLLCILMFVASTIYADGVPTSVNLSTKGLSMTDEVPGNVLVTLSDGKVIQLNNKKNALTPKLAHGYLNNYYVGFVEVELGKDQKTLKKYDTLFINDIFIVYKIGDEDPSFPTPIMAVFKSAKPFIEDWGFLAGGQYIVIKSRAAHGVAMIELFSIGATLDKAAKLGEVEAYKDNLPDWAIPFADPK